MEFIKKIGKSENGSVTVYVLSTLIVVLLVTTTIYIGLRNKTTTQIKQMDKINKEYSVTDTDMQETYDKAIMGTLESVKGTETTNTTVKDSLGNQVVVPAGFKVINPNDNVTKGIVVEDVTHEATKGSQFVWIPVGEVVKEIKDGVKSTETIKLSRYTFADDKVGTPTDQGAKTIESFFTEVNTSTYGNTTAKENIESEKSGFRKSAKDNHGYYIGRYEARDKSATSARTSSSVETNQLVCTANNYVYNYITHPKAAELSRGMYSDSNFESDLMNSYAWDTAIVFLQKFDNRANKASLKPYSRQTSLNNNLARQGTNNLSDTSKQDVICNVYDMAGNCREWTTETYRNSGSPCTYRGGRYYDSYGCTSYRHGYGLTTGRNYGISFRTLLYM